MEEITITPKKKTQKIEKRIFWIRFSIYILFGLIAPISFLIWRFKLFNKISTISIGGWGLVCIIFSAIFIIRLAKQVKKGLPYSFFTQLLNGVIKVIIPLITVTLCLFVIKNCINEVIEFMICLTACEIIAIPSNPFPKWMHTVSENEEINKYKKIYSAITGKGPGENK